MLLTAVKKKAIWLALGAAVVVCGVMAFLGAGLFWSVLGFVVTFFLAYTLVGVRFLGKISTDKLCSQCAYDLRGLPTDTCPECGCEQRDVARVERRWFQSKWIRACLVFSVLFFVVLFVVLWGVQMYADSRRSFNYSHIMGHGSWRGILEVQNGYRVSETQMGDCVFTEFSFRGKSLFVSVMPYGMINDGTNSCKNAVQGGSTSVNVSSGIPGNNVTRTHVFRIGEYVYIFMGDLDWKLEMHKNP